jgi:hypothetical protein
MPNAPVPLSNLYDEGAMLEQQTRSLSKGIGMSLWRSSDFGGPEWDGLPFSYSREAQSRNLQSEPANSNSSNEVLGEVGLVLVIVLGIVLAINLTLVALHMS